ncbi:MAG: enoyl-CoA hydratase-related protein [bacterium]|nr:enoyl-CoA hydratase-related protein [bacterium]
MSDTVHYEKDHHVVTITYQRPERMNAINGPMRDEINTAWLRFRDDEDAWVAILTGSGRAFCAGADVKEGGAAGTFAGTFWEKPTINSFESGLELFKPTIAAINGHCLGYGMTSVSFCDFVIASERATFGFPEVRIGVPTIVGAIRMPQRINWADAMELLLVGEAVNAERAREMGLVWKVVRHDDLMTEARSLANRLCQSAPLAVRATKEVAVRTRSLPWVESVRFGETMRMVVNHTDDATEGRAAFREKRSPNWQGK